MNTFEYQAQVERGYDRLLAGRPWAIEGHLMAVTLIALLVVSLAVIGIVSATAGPFWAFLIIAVVGAGTVVVDRIQGR